MLVDRSNGHISPVVLPEFDNYYSIASWYQDYAAYCGISDDARHHWLIQMNWENARGGECDQKLGGKFYGQ
jgi:hypothetical protein